MPINVGGGVGSAFNTTAGTSVTTGSFFIGAGDEFIVGIALANTSVSVSSVTDTNGGSYTLVKTITNGSSVRVELWSRRTISTTVSITVTVNTTGSTLMAVVTQAYNTTNTSLPQSNASNTGSDLYPSASLTLQGFGDWVVGVHGFVSAPGDTAVSASTAAFRSSTIPSVASVGVAITDNSGGAVAVVGTKVRLSASTNWATALVALRMAGSVGAVGYQAYQGPSTHVWVQQQSIRFSYFPKFCEAGGGGTGGGNSGFTA